MLVPFLALREEPSNETRSGTTPVIVYELVIAVGGVLRGSSSEIKNLATGDLVRLDPGHFWFVKEAQCFL